MCISTISKVAEAASDLLPDCDEWEAKEEPQGASKVSNQGKEGVEEHLLLNLGGTGHCNYKRLRLLAPGEMVIATKACVNGSFL